MFSPTIMLYYSSNSNYTKPCHTYIYVLSAHGNYPPHLHLFLQLDISASSVSEVKSAQSFVNLVEAVPAKNCFSSFIQAKNKSGDITGKFCDNFQLHTWIQGTVQPEFSLQLTIWPILLKYVVWKQTLFPWQEKKHAHHPTTLHFQSMLVFSNQCVATRFQLWCEFCKNCIFALNSWKETIFYLS